MKILVLANSGFGKTSSIGKIPELGIEGLDPNETFIISATKKPLPFVNSDVDYRIVSGKNKPTKEKGNRYFTKNGFLVPDVIKFIDKERPEIKIVVIDDYNYFLQKHYMKNINVNGYTKFNKIGEMVDKHLEAMDEVGRNIIFILMAHPQKDETADGDVTYKIKTVGKMVDNFVTPEGEMTILLYGKTKREGDKVKKVYLTNTDGVYPAKSGGMFHPTEEVEILNDLGIVVKRIREKLTTYK